MDTKYAQSRREDLVRTDGSWEKLYPSLQKQCLRVRSESAMLVAMQSTWSTVWNELRRWGKSLSSWELLLRLESENRADSKRFLKENEQWIQRIHCEHCELPVVRNDWTWLLSVLSDPAEYEKSGLSKFLNQHLAIYERRIWCAARSPSEAIATAIKKIKEETDKTVCEDDVMTYFL